MIQNDTKSNLCSRLAKRNPACYIISSIQNMFEKLCIVIVQSIYIVQLFIAHTLAEGGLEIGNPKRWEQTLKQP